MHTKRPPFELFIEMKYKTERRNQASGQKIRTRYYRNGIIVNWISFSDDAHGRIGRGDRLDGDECNWCTAATSQLNFVSQGQRWIQANTRQTPHVG